MMELEIPFNLDDYTLIVTTLNVSSLRSLRYSNDLKYLFEMCNNEINCIDILSGVDTIVEQDYEDKSDILFEIMYIRLLATGSFPCDLGNVLEIDSVGDSWAYLHRVFRSNVMFMDD